MCGICGVYEKTERVVDGFMLQAMTDAMVHRGPDDEGHFVDVAVGLGFRRLSIVDLEHGHQPMTNEDGSVWIVFNGEIYNFKELRDQLQGRGHTFRTATDTETILHLYEEKGIDCVKQLRGMFAFAIYDRRSKELFLARDYFGIKPLYYFEDHESFIFGSEIRSLLASGRIDVGIDPQSMWNFFTFQYVPDPNTMFRDIKKVPAAHYLRMKHGKTSLHRYWKIEFRPDDAKSLTYFTEGIEARLRDSVRAHLSGDVRRGAFLSSGIDSSAIVALMREVEPVSTFSVGFEDAADNMNELILARESARLLGTDHLNVWVSARRFQDELARLIYQQEDPIADASAIALYFVAQAAREHVTVVLSGEGADEIFAGYPIYHEPMSLFAFEFLPRGLRSQLGHFANLLPVGLKGRSFLQRGSLPLERRFIGNANVHSEEAKRLLIRWTQDMGRIDPVFAVTDPLYQASAHLDPVSRMQYVDLHTWLPGDILMKADKMTMANSLELRVPFLDRDLFEFANTIPLKYRLARGETKFALREAMKNILPQAISRRPKLGFPVPIRQWLRGPLRDFAYDAIRVPGLEEVFDKSYVEYLLETHMQGKRDYSREIWTIVTFSLWYQTYVSGQRSFRPGAYWQPRRDQVQVPVMSDSGAATQSLLSVETS